MFDLRLFYGVDGAPLAVVRGSNSAGKTNARVVCDRGGVLSVEFAMPWREVARGVSYASFGADALPQCSPSLARAILRAVGES